MRSTSHILRLSVATMAGVTFAVSVACITVLYSTAIAGKRSELRELSHVRAAFIETIMELNAETHASHAYAPEGLVSSCPLCEAVITKIVTVLRKDDNNNALRSRLGDFVIAKQDGNDLRFLFATHDVLPDVEADGLTIPWRSGLAEPMRRALSGESGTLEALDYSGEPVLAVYEPLLLPKWGLVSKTDLAIIRAPFVLAATISLCLALLGIVLGSILMRRRINPLIQQANDSNAKVRSALAELRSQKFALDEHAIVAITDPSGKITYANDKFCQISRYSRDELIGQDHRILNSGTHSREFFADLWETIARGDVWHGEICNVAKDGTRYWTDTSIVSSKDAEGRITQYVVVRTDITERTRTRVELEATMEQLAISMQKAEAANTAKSEFLANMSHEIRTPMTAILGFAENLLEPGQSESVKLKCVHTIQRNGQSLLAVINDILDLSKIEAGKMGAERISCDPCRIIGEAVSSVRVLATAKGLWFDMEYDGVIPEAVQTDPVRLRQILVNLIGNAVKFTQTGSVRLVTSLVDDRDEPRLQFDVIDTGCGMTKEQAVTLFQPFTQADTSTTRKFGGTGLGLTISKRFAEMLGGDISVVRTEPGAGTTFRATIATGSLDGVTMREDPMSATVVLDAASAAPSKARFDLRGLRILLAEDGPDNQRLISCFLEKDGAEVTVMENGKLAVEAAQAARDQKKPFDVILMDMQMPVMDGYEATRLLRGHGYAAPIIALTAHAMEGDRKKCIQAGCDDYASKPVDRKKLTALILKYVTPVHRGIESKPTGTSDPLSLHGCRILLAEDNPTSQALIAGILKKADAQITAVKDGKLAVDAALAARRDGHPFDIILMDIQMPLMRGDEATILLREKAYTGTIIALTAHALVGDRRKFLDVGFDDYATKPVNRAKLIETIHTHLQQVNA